MAYYYVKDDGTAESGTASGDQGRHTSAKSGDWTTAFTATTEYYASIGDAVAATTTPTDGDYILVSDLHSKTYDNLGSVELNLSGTTTGGGLFIISVDDTACDEYKPGASEELSDTADDYVPNFNGLIAGVDLWTGDNTFIGDINGRHWTIQDCTMTIDANGDFFFNTSQQGTTLKLVNVNFDANATNINSGIFEIKEGCEIIWDGGGISAANGDIDALLLSTSCFQSGGGKLICKGLDLTNLNDGAIFPTTAGATTHDQFLARFESCKLSPTVSLPVPGTDIHHPFHRCEMFNCDDSTGGALHRFFVADGCGIAQNNDSVYVTANPAFFEGSDKSSISVTTSSTCNAARPFVFEIPARYIDLGDTGVSDTVSINIISELTLTNCEIAFFLVYPDGTTPVQPNWITSGKTVGTGNYGTDPLAALIGNDTELNTTGALGSGDWTDGLTLTTPNYYKVNLDTNTNDPGEAFLCGIRCEVYRTIAGTSGNRVFIDPVLTVGT